ncbi:MAG: HAD family hydrolase [Pseudomonadales bacterium]|nr:HAD family hydrolase [Pseudomonadales bacterium]
MKAVVFDLDETLIDRSSAVTRFAERLWESNLSNGELSQIDFVNDVHLKDRHGYTPRDEFFTLMWEAYSKAFTSKSTIEDAFYDQVWETPVLAEGVIEWLSRLRELNIPLGIVSNGSTRAQQAKIKHSGIGDYFSVTIVSEAFGVKKPDPTIYQSAADQLGLSAHECWFVGDHPVNDVWGSKQVGFQTAWVHLNRPWLPDLDPCYDVKGESFSATMDAVLEKELGV